jgi:hypothetical protein
MRDEMQYRSGNVLKGALAGLVGGLVAAFVMSEFQSVWNKFAGRKNRVAAKSRSPQPSRLPK